MFFSFALLDSISKFRNAATGNIRLLFSVYSKEIRGNPCPGGSIIFGGFMKWINLIVTVFALTTRLSADPFLGDQIESNLDVTYSYSHDQWVIGLGDGSCWKLKPLGERPPQSWSQWWNRQEPKEWQLPEEYFFDPSSWKTSFAVEVYRAAATVSKSYQHIIVNVQTGEKAFAEYIPCGSQFIPKIAFAEQVAQLGEPQESKAVNTYPFLGDVLALDNGTVWNLYLMGENQPSWAQWWSEVEIDQPDGLFITNLDDWSRDDRILIHHAKFTDDALHRKYGVSQPLYEVFLLENTTRGKIVYANALLFGEFLDTFEESIDEKANKAYLEGFSNGYEAGYHEGGEDGFQKGFDQGMETAREKLQM